jgi:rhodanese-related sulfurtransferase
MDMKVSSTIGYERAHNELLTIGDEDSFVERALASLGPQPPNFQAVVDVNRGPLFTDRVSAEPLTPRQLQQKLDEGALLVDVRTELQFDDAHVPGAICNPAVRAGFGTKLAWIADREQEVVFLGRDGDDAMRAAHLAGSVGITKLGGYLAGGMTSWREDKRETASIERIDVDDLHERWESSDGLQILDVRERGEWEREHIPGSVHVPYHDVHGVPDGIDPERPIGVICSSGQRSAVAASVLQREGAGHPVHVTGGGVGTWRRNGWPVESGQP